jgi:hypothetical protein
MREQGDARKNIAALEAKVIEAGSYLKQAGDVLLELGSREIRLDVEFLHKVDIHSLVDTISELRAERAKAEALGVQLQKFS